MTANAAYIVANERPKIVIWAARDLVLPQGAKHRPSMWRCLIPVSTSVFLGMLWTNLREVVQSAGWQFAA